MYHDFDQVIATQETFRENETLRARLTDLEKELSLCHYEKSKLQSAFEDMKRKIEDRVPVIAEVEKRRLELEDEVIEKAKEIRNL